MCDLHPEINRSQSRSGIQFARRPAGGLRSYIKSQAHEGWRLARGRYDDGAFSGASLDRPALQELLTEVSAGKIDIIVVYKVDRLTRSLADFAKLVERRAQIEPFASVINGSLAAARPRDPVLRARAAAEIAQIRKVKEHLAKRVALIPFQAEEPAGVERLNSLAAGVAEHVAASGLAAKLQS
jgi:hypothetical protein